MKHFRNYQALHLLVFSLCLLPLGGLAQSDSEDRVQTMYIAYYGRPGDPEGLQYWADSLDSNGGNLAELIDAFGTSQEYNDRFSALDDSSLVNGIYKQLLNSDADSGGLVFYLDNLNQGLMSLTTIAINIADGIEDGNSDAAIVANKLTVANAYTLAVSEGQLAYGSDQIDSAKSLLQAVDGTDSSVSEALIKLPTSALTQTQLQSPPMAA